MVARKADTPCSTCGALLWRGSTSLEDPKCRPCRKAERCGTENGYRKGCRCERCKTAKKLAMATFAVRRRDEGRPIPRGGSWLSRADRAYILTRDAFTCQLCGAPLDMGATHNAPTAPTIDHITPRSHGGTDEPDNLRAACRACNSARSDNLNWAPEAMAS